MEEDQPCEVGRTCVPRSGIVLLLLTVLILSALSLYALWSFWPTSTPAGTAPPSERVTFLWVHMTLRSEVMLFVVVAVAGALGGLIHTLRSLSWYVGNRHLRWSWLPFYLFLPLVGATLATVFYLTLRGGLFSSSTTTAQVNAYGFSAVGALSGLFSEQATEKLRTVFTALFTDAKQGQDHVAPAEGPPLVTVGTTAATGSGATLTAGLDPRGQETTFSFEYGTSPAYGQTTGPQKASGAGQRTVRAEVTGLIPATRYHFRLVASNSAGVTEGQDQTFTTLGSNDT